MFRAFILSESDPPFNTSHKDEKGQSITGGQVNIRIETDEITGFVQIPNPLANGKDPTQPPTIDDPDQPIYRAIYDGAFFVPGLDVDDGAALLAVCQVKGQAEVDAHEISPAQKKPSALPLGVELDPSTGTSIATIKPIPLPPTPLPVQ